MEFDVSFVRKTAIVDYFDEKYFLHNFLVAFNVPCTQFSCANQLVIDDELNNNLSNLLPEDVFPFAQTVSIAGWFLFNNSYFNDTSHFPTNIYQHELFSQDCLLPNTFAYFLNFPTRFSSSFARKTNVARVDAINVSLTSTSNHLPSINFSKGHVDLHKDTNKIDFLKQLAASNGVDFKILNKISCIYTYFVNQKSFFDDLNIFSLTYPHVEHVFRKNENNIDNFASSLLTLSPFLLFYDVDVESQADEWYMARVIRDNVENVVVFNKQVEGYQILINEIKSQKCKNTIECTTKHLLARRFDLVHECDNDKFYFTKNNDRQLLFQSFFKQKIVSEKFATDTPIRIVQGSHIQNVIIDNGHISKHKKIVMTNNVEKIFRMLLPDGVDSFLKNDYFVDVCNNGRKNEDLSKFKSFLPMRPVREPSLVQITNFDKYFAVIRDFNFFAKITKKDDMIEILNQNFYSIKIVCEDPPQKIDLHNGQGTTFKTSSNILNIFYDNVKYFYFEILF